MFSWNFLPPDVGSIQHFFHVDLSVLTLAPDQISRRSQEFLSRSQETTDDENNWSRRSMSFINMFVPEKGQ